MAINIAIYIYDGVETLDFASPYEVFSTASRVCKMHGLEESFNVFTISRTPNAVRARGGLEISPHYSLENHPEIDVLLLAGGLIIEELKQETLFAWIESIATSVKCCAAISTGAFLVAEAGLLDGKKATTHFEDVELFESYYPLIEVEKQRRIVSCEGIITCAGVSAALDMSFHLTSELLSYDMAKATAEQMQYAWNETF